MRPDGSGVRQITHNDGYYGLISPDGKWLYYSVPLKGLWKMPAEGGEATQALARPSLLGYDDSSSRSRRGVSATGRVRQPRIASCPLPTFDGGKPRTLTTLGSNPQMFPELSPDGRWFLYTSADSPVFEIMLVDNFPATSL